MPDGEPLPAGGPVTVSLARWGAERECLRGRGAPLGVRIGPADAVESIAADLDRLDLIAIEFPAFTEGRGYSQARLLRQRHGFAGELRATGDVARDRVEFMRRCGFDAFALRQDQDPAAAARAFAEISVRFQAAADDAGFAARQRRWRA